MLSSTSEKRENEITFQRILKYKLVKMHLEKKLTTLFAS